MKISLRGLLLAAAIIFSCTFSLSGQNHTNLPPEKPKLIVTIVIDQFRYDYIYKFWDKLDENGLVKMVQEGSFCKNAQYNYLLNETSVGHATISTGAYPSHHGIISNNWYVSLKDEVINCVIDENIRTVGGSYEAGRTSPSQLLASTLGDELKLSNNFKSKVVGIAIDNSAAILSSGHTADFAYWLDDASGNWVSSTYYMDSLPVWVEEFNAKKLPDTYLENTWETLYPLESYTESWGDTSTYESGFNGRNVFPYDLNAMSLVRRDERNYDLLKSTPWGNVYTKDFAIACIVNDSLGYDKYTDMLTVGFSANEYIGKRFGSNSVEMQDAVLRLDKEIAHFLTFLDDYLGEENTLVILTADHGLTYNPEYLTDQGIPSGEFSYRSAISLLGSYMNIVYEKGNWIKHYYAQQLYLNRELIEDSQIPLQEIQDRVAQFLIQFEGVSNATTSYTLQTTSFTEGIFRKIQNGYHQKRSGDVIISLSPGWTEKPEENASYHSSYIADNHVPLIWYGWKIRRSTISRPVNMIDIVPTLSHFLEISRPNASQGDIILELVE